MDLTARDWFLLVVGAAMSGAISILVYWFSAWRSVVGDKKAAEAQVAQQRKAFTGIAEMMAQLFEVLLSNEGATYSVEPTYDAQGDLVGVKINVTRKVAFAAHLQTAGNVETKVIRAQVDATAAKANDTPSS